MRKDMAKVIVERPRQGGNKTNTERREANTPLEELPKKQSMRRKHRERKSLNENLKPLERFFRSQLGRPWDKVYSEVCANISTGSTVQQHVRQHISGMVTIHVVANEGKLFRKDYYFRFHGSGELYHEELYVDPNSGILRKYKAPHRRVRFPKWDSERAQLEALKGLDLVLEKGQLFKIERSKPRSPKKPVVESKVLANSTHARQDHRFYPERTSVFISKHLTKSLLREEYFRVLVDLQFERNRLKAQEKAALKRKEEADKLAQAG